MVSKLGLTLEKKILGVREAENAKQDRMEIVALCLFVSRVPNACIHELDCRSYQGLINANKTAWLPEHEVHFVDEKKKAAAAAAATVADKPSKDVAVKAEKESSKEVVVKREPEAAAATAASSAKDAPAQKLKIDESMLTPEESLTRERILQALAKKQTTDLSKEQEPAKAAKHDKHDKHDKHHDKHDKHAKSDKAEKADAPKASGSSSVKADPSAAKPAADKHVSKTDDKKSASATGDAKAPVKADAKPALAKDKPAAGSEPKKDAKAADIKKESGSMFTRIPMA